MARFLVGVVALVACGSKPEAGSGSGSSSGSGSGSAVVVMAVDATLPDAPAPDAATDFIASTDVPDCHAELAATVTACLVKALAGTVDEPSKLREADVELARIAAKDGKHTFVLAKSGDTWRVVGRVFVETAGPITSELEITRLGETAHATRIDLKVEIVQEAGDDTDHETTKTASIICPRLGPGNAITACSKPYVLTCDSKGYTSYRSRATLDVRNDGTLAYTIAENATPHSPCALP